MQREIFILSDTSGAAVVYFMGKKSKAKKLTYIELFYNIFFIFQAIQSGTLQSGLFFCMLKWLPLTFPFLSKIFLHFLKT